MDLKSLVPWNWGKRDVPVHREEENPVVALQREINRAFDSFWNGFGTPMKSGMWGNVFDSEYPRVEVSETDSEVEISAELPGMSQEDIDVSVTEDMIRIKGEKKSEKEEKKKDFYLSERSYGAFQRAIPLPSGLDLNKANATFKNGVLNVTLPKTEEARANVKRIPVTTN